MELNAESIRQSVQLEQIEETLEYQGERINQLEAGVDSILGSQHPCGGTGWVKVMDLDMAKPAHTCPTGWSLTSYTKRTCGRTTTTPGSCDVTLISVDYPSPYSKVCGRVTAYAFGGPAAFRGFDPGDTVTDHFADGVVFYHGSSNDGHIWTFAAGASEVRGETEPLPRNVLCPCDPLDDVQSPGLIPDFIGNDYFCESQNLEILPSNRNDRRLYSGDVLWDSRDCIESSNCCEFNRPPYFVKELPSPTSEDIKASICLNFNINNANIAVEIVELYVHE